MLGKTKITTRSHRTSCGLKEKVTPNGPNLCPVFVAFTRCFLKDTQVNVVDGDGRRPLTLSAMENQLPCALHLLEASVWMQKEFHQTLPEWKKIIMDWHSSCTYQSHMFFSNSPDIWEGTWNFKFVSLKRYVEISPQHFIDDILWQPSTYFSKIGSWDVPKVPVVASRLWNIVNLGF